MLMAEECLFGADTTKVDIKVNIITTFRNHKIKLYESVCLHILDSFKT